MLFVNTKYGIDRVFMLIITMIIPIFRFRQEWTQLLW